MIAYYASPTGFGDGLSYESPSSLLVAKQLVRDNNHLDNITVFLLGGRYDFSAGGLTFSSLDSSINGYKTRWCRIPGDEAPIFNGGVNPTSAWTLHDTDKNIWVADCPIGLNARNFYVNGVRATRSYWRGDSNHFYDNWSGSIVFTSSEFPSLSHGDVEFWVWPGSWPWVQFRVTAVAYFRTGDLSRFQLNAESEIIRDWYGAASGLEDWSTIYRCENAYEFLIDPGEFYIDTSASKIYYIPRNNDDMTTAECWIPKCETLIYGDSSISKGIAFSGIIFEHTSWMRVTEQGTFIQRQDNMYIDKDSDPPYCDVHANLIEVSPGVWELDPTLPIYYPKAGIEFEKCNGITFESNVFRHMGGEGLHLRWGAQDCFVAGNLFHDISSTGIRLGDPKYWLASEPEENKTLRNMIRSNHIFNVGIEYLGSAGFDSMSSGFTKILHNHVHDVPYTGISHTQITVEDFTIAEDHEIAYNKVHGTLQSTFLNDGGGIYTAGVVKNRTIHDNYLYDHAERYIENYATWRNGALYSDNWAGQSHGTTYYRNVVFTGEDKTGNNVYATSFNNFGEPWALANGWPASPVISYDNYIDLTIAYRDGFVADPNIIPPTRVDPNNLPHIVSSIINKAGLESLIIGNPVDDKLPIFGWKSNTSSIIEISIQGPGELTDFYEDNDTLQWWALIYGYIDGVTIISLDSPASMFTPSGNNAGILLNPSGISGGTIMRKKNNNWSN